MLEYKASGCSHAFYSERLFTFYCKCIKDKVWFSDFIFPGLFRNKCNSLSMWECWCQLAYIYGQMKEACFEPVLFFWCLLEMSLQGIICVLCFQCHLVNSSGGITPNSCLLLSVPCELVSLDAICAPCFWWWERLLGGMGLHMHSLQPNNSHACLTLTTSMYAQVLCWRGMVKSSRHFYTQTCSLYMGRITDLCECGNVWAWELIAPEWVCEHLPCLAANLSFFYTTCNT